LVLRGLAADRVSGGDNTGQRTKPSGEKGGGIFTQIKKWLKDEVDVEDFKQ
jgi:hypothetical protein